MALRCPAPSLVLALTALAAATLAAGPAADAQERPRFEWPERGENLQVLPEGLGGGDLRAVMLGFSRALGVNCYHCHVGGPELQLHEFDFVSDRKAEKGKAREMMRMVRAINGEWLPRVEAIDGGREEAGEGVADGGHAGAPVEVGCVTCHRGQPRPVMLEELLWATVESEGAEAAVTRYRELRERHYGGFTYDFGEATLNSLGYRLLAAGKSAEAIAVFRLNVEMYPHRGNPWDSLAEAYAAAGDVERAIAFYQRALSIDPGNDHAARQLGELRRRPPEPGPAVAP